MSGQQSRETPLAWSQSGDSFDVPETALVWRVRRLTGNMKGGAPELVYGPDGLPLLLDITATPADLTEAVEGKPGKYRLDALDELRKTVPGTPAAYFLLAGSSSSRPDRAEQSPTNDVAVRALADALKNQADALGQAFKQQSDQFSGLIAQVRELAQVLVPSRSSPSVPPTPITPPVTRNGAPDEDEDEDEDDDDDQDDDDGQEEHVAPTRDLFEKLQTFCTVVPADNIRALGEVAAKHGPTVVAGGIRAVVREGLGGFLTADQGSNTGDGQ